MRGALCALLCLAACTPTHLERAREHHAAAQAAQAKGDEVRARTELEATAQEARRSVEAEEEGGGAGQAWLLVAWAELGLGRSADAEKSLARVRAAGLLPSRPWQRRVLVAAHCRLAEERGWHHFAALCHDHLLGVADEAAPGLRAFAVEGFANAQAKRLPAYVDLLASFDHPLLTRLHAAARAHPLEGDLVVILARRLALFCRDEAFTAQIAGWRALQRDLLEAAVAFDAFTTDDRRQSAQRLLGGLEARALCPRVK